MIIKKFDFFWCCEEVENLPPELSSDYATAYGTLLCWHNVNQSVGMSNHTFPVIEKS